MAHVAGTIPGVWQGEEAVNALTSERRVREFLSANVHAPRERELGGVHVNSAPDKIQRSTETRKTDISDRTHFSPESNVNVNYAIQEHGTRTNH